MARCEIALWLRSFSSSDPDILEERDIDPSLPLREAVYALMREYKETYVSKVTVRFFGLPLPLAPPACPVSTLEVVKALYPLVEADGLDPVVVRAAEALGLVHAWASADSESLFARWSQSALAVDERRFIDYWNHRRSTEVRARLLLEAEAERQEHHE